MKKIEKYQSEYDKSKVFDTVEECEEYDKKYSTLAELEELEEYKNKSDDK